MADRYLLESGTPDGYLLEDGTGVALLEVANGFDVLLVVADSAAPTTDDAIIKYRLESFGYAVTYRSDDLDDSTAGSFDLVVIASSVTSATVGTKYKATVPPVIVLEDGIYDDQGLASAQTGVGSFPTTWNITGTAHPIRGDVPSGVTTVYTVGTGFQVSNNSHAAAAVPIAASVTNANDYIVWCYVAGDTLSDATTAAHPVVAFAMLDSGTDHGAQAGNAQMWELFRNAAAWAIATAAAGTNAAAGLASGTGAASNVSGSVLPNTGIGTGTGLANNAAGSVKVNTGVATGTGLANNATTLLASNASAGAATGTGAAANVAASVKPNAGVGTGTGSAGNATTLLASKASAGLASGTGAAGDIDAAIKVNAGIGSGTGTASNATVTTAKSAAAGTATGAGAAANATTSIKASANVATGTGTASGAQGSDQASAIIATGTGAAYNAAPTTLVVKNVDAETATGTGAALDPAIAIKVNAGSAAGTGAASDPFALVPGATAASAGTATGSGTAYNASTTGGVVVVPPVRRPLPKSRRRDSLAVDAWDATATGTAHDATIRTITKAGTATGTGTAHNASIVWNDDETAILVLMGDLELAA